MEPSATMTADRRLAGERVRRLVAESGGGIWAGREGCKRWPEGSVRGEPAQGVKDVKNIIFSL